MTNATKRTRYEALRGFWYPKTVTGYEVAVSDASVRPGDPRIEWERVERGEIVAAPYAAIVKSWTHNKLVKEVK